MSIHSSLRSGGANKKHRSVLKRYERLASLKGNNAWDEEKPVLGLPKVKQQKLKVKKEKTTGTAAVAGAPAAAAKTEAPKAAAGKSDKK